MGRDELGRTARTMSPKGPQGRLRGGLARLTRLGMTMSLVAGLLTVVAVAVDSTPAFAAVATHCTAPVNAGTSVTFVAGALNTYDVVCYGTGLSTATYPTSITVASGALPADATFPTTQGGGCVQSHSGSGTTEHYTLTCTITDTPAQSEIGSYAVTFLATGGGGAPNFTSGTLSLTVAATTLTCTAPASGGSATTFYVGAADSYAVSCYGTGASSQTYPTSIVANGSLPSDATFPTTQGGGCVQSTSGSGTTELYILTCTITETPTNGDIGTYTSTFTADGIDGATTTSGTLTLTVSGPVTTCSAPAPGGSATTFTVGTASNYSVTCYQTGLTSAAYPASITVASGALPADATFPTTTGGGCTQSTSGSGVSEHYILTCKVSETPTLSDEGTYPVTFLVTGAGGAPNYTSSTWTLSVKPVAPTWASGQYFVAVQNVAFCDDVSLSTADTLANGALPLTSITLGSTPSGITSYSIQNINLTTGTAQICGTDTNTPITSGTSSPGTTLAPVATNGGGSATDNIPIASYGACTWTSGSGTTQVFDANQDLYQTGTQSSFGAAITNGETLGSTSNYTTCTGAMVSESGSGSNSGLGDAFTVNTANPLPAPVETNPSAVQGDLASSNLYLGSGGCWGAVNLAQSYTYGSFGSASSLTTPSPWVNGGTCTYGTLGSNQAGGNTDTTNATCPPSQADVNEGYVSCSITASSGNNFNGSVNYSTDDLFYNGQPVPQQSTATLSATGALAGGTVSVTGGTNWWGSAGGAPNTGPYGDAQSGAYYQVSAPTVWIGTTRGTAVQATTSTVTIGANQYVCTGAESATVGPNPCTMNVGQITGSFTVPASLTPGTYNVYIDETNATPLPGNGPNDAYQTARGTNLGTAESATQLVVGPPVFTSGSSTTFTENSAGSFQVTATGDNPISYSETGSLPSGVTLSSGGLLSGTPAVGTAGTYPITITATDVNSNTTDQSFTLTVNASASGPVFTSGTGTLFFENSAGSFQVTATGNTPITFSETGALPSGVTLTSGGLLSGTPASGTAGTYPITITATDVDSNTTDQSFTLTVIATGPVFTSGNSTTFTENSSGSFQATATGDTPITFSETGSLPSGVTLSSAGLLSGTPAFGTAGSYPVTITATDVNSNTTDQSFTLTVDAAAPVFTSGTGTLFFENSPGSFQVTADGDTPISFSETGSLPSGVTLSSAGLLSGTPAFGTAGTYPVTITATDTNSNTTDQSFTLTVGASAPVFTSGTSTTFTENSSGSFQATATGDTPISFSETGSLPSGVTLSSGGLLSGTPANGTAGTYPITITATDTNSNTTNQSFTLTVNSGSIVPGGAITLSKSIGLIGNYPDKVSGTGWQANGDTSVTIYECATTTYSASSCDAANQVSAPLGTGTKVGRFTNVVISLAVGTIDSNSDTCGVVGSGSCYVVVVGNTGDQTASGVLGFTLSTATINKSIGVVGNYQENVHGHYFPIGDTVTAVECDSAVDPATNLSSNCDPATAISGTVASSGSVVFSPTGVKLKVLVGDAYSDSAAGACATGGTCQIVVYDTDNAAIAENLTLITAIPTAKVSKTTGVVGNYLDTPSAHYFPIGDTVTAVECDPAVNPATNLSTNCDPATAISVAAGSTGTVLWPTKLKVLVGAAYSDSAAGACATGGTCDVVIYDTSNAAFAENLTISTAVPTAKVSKTTGVVGNYLDTASVKYFPIGDTVNAVECDPAVNPATNLSTNCDLGTTVSGTVGATGSVVIPTKLKVLVGAAYSDSAAGACATGSTCDVVVYDASNSAIAETLAIATATPTVTIAPTLVANANGATVGVTAKYFPIGDTVDAVECDTTMVPANASTHCDSATQLSGVAGPTGEVAGYGWTPTTRLGVLTTATTTQYSDTAGGSCSPDDSVANSDPCFVYVNDTANSSFFFTPALSIKP
jgi:Putative Ig domain